MRSAVLVFIGCCVCGVLGGGTSDAFNTEIFLRAKDNINIVFTFPQTAVRQISTMFAFGGLEGNSATTQTKLRQLVFSNFLGTDGTIHSINAAFEQGWSLQFQEQAVVIANNATQVCWDSQVQQPCANVYVYDQFGAPTQATGSRTLNFMAEEWYTIAQQNRSWASVQNTTDGLVLAYSARINDPQNQFLGAASCLFHLRKLNQALIDAFYDETFQTAVFITDSDGLIAASTGINVTKITAPGQTARVHPLTCGDVLIEAAARILQRENFAADGTLHISDGYYIQLSEVELDSASKWNVVVIRPAPTAYDYIRTSSSTATFVFVLCGIWLFVTAALGLWFFKHRNSMEWAPVLIAPTWAILFSNAVNICSGFVLTGHPTFSLCQGRQWIVALAITLSISSIVARMWAMVICYEKAANSRAHTPLLIVAVLGGAQIVAQIIWSAADPFDEKFEAVLIDDVLTQTHRCASSHKYGLILSALVEALAIGVGLYVVHLGRQKKDLPASARHVILVFFHSLLLLMMVGLVAGVASISNESLDLFIFLVLVWFSVTTQAVLFAPHMNLAVLSDMVLDRSSHHNDHHSSQQHSQSHKSSHKATSQSNKIPTISATNPAHTQEDADFCTVSTVNHNDTNNVPNDTNNPNQFNDHADPDDHTDPHHDAGTHGVVDQLVDSLLESVVSHAVDTPNEDELQV